MDKPCPLLWLDLESLGLNADDQIIEVAACLTEPTAPFQRIDRGEYRALVAPVPPYVVGDVVLAMHTTNGLWRELQTEPTATIAEVERDLLAYIGRHVHGSKVTLAGAEVSRFDYGMIERWMPRVARRLTYYTFDVSVVRRWMESCGQAIERDEGDYRAWADVQRALDQARAISSRQATPGHWVCATCLSKIDGPMVAAGNRVMHYPECP